MSSKKRARSPEVSPVMRGLATYMSRAIRKPLPKLVLEKTKHHVLDTIASMVSGSRLLPGLQAISYIKSRAGKPEACVAGSHIVTTVENAALANGMLGHADETDDSHAPTSQHPGCAIVPAALAMAEREHRDGAALLRAVALGYDISARINRALHTYDFQVAGHSTHSFGPTFGAAAAAGALAGLGYDQTRHMLSYCAQQVSGISCFQRDTDHIEKAFDFGGMPARNGVTAASMAAHDFTAVEDVFAGERNFFVAYDESGRIGKAPQPEWLIRELGSTYEIMTTSIKRWSVGSPVQAPLSSLQELIRAHGIKAGDIEHMEVRIGPFSFNTVNNNKMPNICIQYLCAAMLLDGMLTFASSHDQKRMKDKRVMDVRSRIAFYADDSLANALPPRQGNVMLRLRDGRELRHHTRAVSGTPDNPMQRADVDEKAYHLMAPILGTKRARSLCDAVWRMDSISSVRRLRPLLAA